MWWLEQDLYVYWALYNKLRESGEDPENFTPKASPGTLVGAQRLTDQELQKLLAGQDTQKSLKAGVAKLQGHPTKP